VLDGLLLLVMYQSLTIMLWFRNIDLWIPGSNVLIIICVKRCRVKYINTYLNTKLKLILKCSNTALNDVYLTSNILLSNGNGW